MKRILVSDKRPVSLYTGVFEEYTREGIGIDAGHIILSRKGHAILRINFERVVQEKDSVTILFPGDVVMVEEHSDDFELEYLIFTDKICSEVFSLLQDISIHSVSKVRNITSYQLARIVDSMFSILSKTLHIGTVKYTHYATIMQLRSFYAIYQAYLIENGFDIDIHRTHQDKLFSKFMGLLSEHYKESRSVAFYADKMCITTKYLTIITGNHTAKTAKTIIDEYTIMQLRLELQHSDKPLSQIAACYNFSSFSFFSDYFKRHTGENPQAYRQKIDSKN